MEKLSFKALRTEKNLNQEDVAKLLNISRQSYRNKEVGKTEFTFKELMTLADFFGCSIDLFRHPNF